MFEVYNQQVQLVLKCLPVVARTTNFALKGGTAINMFIRDQYPRLSVDIDLCYLPIQPRAESLLGIETGLLEIMENLQGAFAYKIAKSRNATTKTITKLVVDNSIVEIKIEPNLILRGTIYPIIYQNTSKVVDELYGLPVYGMPLLAVEEIYAGKICAALDRQHPRDLFDIKFILEEGLTDRTKNAFLIYLISHNRPMHELLTPNRLDQAEAYKNEFAGMTDLNISYEEMAYVREKLIQSIKDMLNVQDKKFLISVENGAPNWELLQLPNVTNLPGVKWKLINLNKMDKQKAKDYLAKLEAVLYD